MSELTIPVIPSTVLCEDFGTAYTCTRPKGHGGRHVGGYWADGDRTQIVCGVWGEDVHRAARERGRTGGAS